MPSCKITYAETKEITVWIPDNTNDAEKAQIAEHHVSQNVLAGQKAKLLSVEWTPETVPGNVEALK